MAPFWWHIAGYVLGVLGLLALAWWAWGDRARGRRRCRKCWYSMTDAVADRDGRYVCPECGKVAKSERALLRTRRRKRWIATALAMWLVGYAAWTTPRAYEHGWPGAVPTTVMVLGLPVLADYDFRDPPATGSRNGRAKPTGIEQVSEQLLSRARRNELWKWQWRMLMRVVRLDVSNRLARRRGAGFMAPHCIDLIDAAMDHDRLTAADIRALDRNVHLQVQAPAQWPVGQPIYARVGVRRWWLDGGHWESRDPASGLRCANRWQSSKLLVNYAYREWSDGRHPLAVPDPATGAYEVDVAIFRREPGDWTTRLARRYRHSGQVEISGAIEDYKTPVSAPTLASFFEQHIGFTPSLRSNGSVGVTLRFRPEVQHEVRAGLLDLCEAVQRPTIGGRLELLDGNQTVRATGIWWWRASGHERREVLGETHVRVFADYSSTQIELEPTPDTPALPAWIDEDWRLRIVPDATVTLRDMDNPLYLNEHMLLAPLDTDR
ncbi:MAG: hypothetical protein AAF138_06450 [Planctomycetota bacterium]